MPDSLTAERQRIDRWLWHARVMRTRSEAAAFAASGRVRVNGQRIDAPARNVRCGDVITLVLEQGIRIMKVVGFINRRGPAQTARLLYEDLDFSPSPAVAARPQVRERGSGRPTKRDRRAIERLLGRQKS